MLVGVQVSQPLGKEGGDIHIKAGGANKNLRISGPAQPLIALRAVGRDIDDLPFCPHIMLC